MSNVTNIPQIQQPQIDTTSQQNGVKDIKEAQVATISTSQQNQDKKINSPEDMDKLVSQLNDTISLMNKDLKFGVDTNDVFYVSVIDKKSNHVISRFPAEKAADFLPKMKEVTGILFDSKG